MNISRTTVTIVLALGLLSGVLAACKGLKVNERSVEQVFSDPQAAALANAACRGDAKRVAALVRAGASPNALGERSATPLSWAVRCENLQGIEALLKLGANPNHRADYDMTLVGLASGYRNSDVLRLLLRYGGSPNSRHSTDGHSSAWEAIMLGANEQRWENYYQLLAAGLDINAHNEVGNTAALELASLDQWDKVAELLDRGYKHDLDTLGFYTQHPDLNDPRQNAAKLRVNNKLRAQGVNFPVPHSDGTPWTGSTDKQVN